MYINLKMFKILILTSLKILFISFLLISNALTDVIKSIKSQKWKNCNETIIMFAKIQSINDVNENDLIEFQRSLWY